MMLDVKGKTATVQALRTLLGDLDNWQINAMIEDGRLSWAINVASAGSKARDLRIPVCCVRDCSAGIVRDFTADEIGRFLFGNGPIIEARAFYRALEMKHSHFYALVREGAIRLAKGCRPRRGPNGGVRVTWLDALFF